MISLRDNFNSVKRKERREKGRERGKDKQTEKGEKVMFAKKCQTTKILA